MYYFASDMHLGLGSKETVREREGRLVKWLNDVCEDASAIYIMGDMFDFWYEFKRVVPKGFTRLLGTLSSLTDKGVEIHFFPGNHDMWAFDYLREECGVILHHAAEIHVLNGKRIFMAHGDNIYVKPPAGVRVLNCFFRSGTARWMFSHLLHPDAGLRLGNAWSRHSRKSKSVAHIFLKEEEPMVRYARKYAGESEEHIDYFIFGHNHIAEIYPIVNNTKVVFLGEWIERPTYAVLDEQGNIELKQVAF